jgi:phenazine biosynthesis protein phzE
MYSRKQGSAGDSMFRATIDRLIANRHLPFALMHRASTGNRLELLTGELSTIEALDQLPDPDHDGDGDGSARHDLLLLMPFRQIRERGFECVDDRAPMWLMRVTEQHEADRDTAVAWLPDHPVVLSDAAFDKDDAAYATIVRTILSEEIGRGEGSNFVLKRCFLARLDHHDTAAALSIFRRLLERENHAYWTFAISTGEGIFIGATPESHAMLADGELCMNPISGTYRYPADGPCANGLVRFLGDRKEADELYMVVDEELKMMASLCEDGGHIVGPVLKEMACLAHTGYVLRGACDQPVRDILRETMFSPALTGSPLESACRVIRRHEPDGRRHYGGVVALIGRDADARPALDSAILIRTADIDPQGQLRIAVGATLVRHSDPQSEAAETTAKLSCLLQAIRGDAVTDQPDTPVHATVLGALPGVQAALRQRNQSLADFWLRAADSRRRQYGGQLSGRVLILDAGDNFTHMLRCQLAAMGADVAIAPCDGAFAMDRFDLVLVGPGPGDPQDADHPRLRALRRITRQLLAERRPFLSVCLGHQVLSDILGLPLRRLAVPQQGVQREIDLFGQTCRVGFYNTFVAIADTDRIEPQGMELSVEISRDALTGEVHGLRSERFCSLQFHPESVLSRDGLDVLRYVTSQLMYSPHQVPRTAAARS